jgi:hypothetical protein
MMSLLFAAGATVLFAATAALKLHASVPDAQRPQLGHASHSPHIYKPSRLADADILPKTASRDLSILYYLGIARGHLIASIALAQQGKLDQSVLHSRHALDEAWLELSTLLATEDADALRPKFEAVNESIALKSPLSSIASAHEDAQALIERIAAAAYSAAGERLNSTMDLVLLLLKQAEAEYEEAWDNFRLKNRLEYQDGFGFIAVANDELQDVYHLLQARNPQAATQIKNTMEHVVRAWPSHEPPATPVMSKPVLRALVTAVELYAKQLSD